MLWMKLYRELIATLTFWILREVDSRFIQEKIASEKQAIETSIRGSLFPIPWSGVA